MTKIRTNAGALRARGATLRALRAAGEALVRLAAFEGGHEAALTSVRFATANLDGSIRLALGLADGWDGEELGDEVASSFGSARRVLATVDREINAVAGACAARAEHERTERLALALASDPRGSRFEALDEEQERLVRRSARRAS